MGNLHRQQQRRMDGRGLAIGISLGIISTYRKKWNKAAGELQQQSVTI